MNKHVLKLFCLFASVLIWIQVASGVMRVREVDLPLRFDGLPGNLTLAGNEWPETVRLRARGSKWRFFLSRYFGNRPGEVVVDLSGVDPGIRYVKDLTAGDVRTSLTEVVVLDPDRLELDVDRLDSLPVAVAVATKGELSAEWMLLSPLRAVPDSVPLAGPSRFLSRDLLLRTVAVDLSRIHGSGTIKRGLVSPHPHLDPLQESVQVFVEAAAVGRRVFEHVPLVPLLDTGQPHVEVFPPVASVEISGPVESLAVLTASSISLTVSSSGLDSGAHTVRPEVMLPEHCRLITLDPEEFMLVVGGAPHRDGAP
ncbi:hypothetical protein KKG45_13960 [bacterium]|nr:hypothetical protein [bacterium]MBU1074344.1 hypothetical protein [bacterium]MBU1674191.1 hypothetical protein [bacterium]